MDEFFADSVGGQFVVVGDKGWLLCIGGTFVLGVEVAGKYVLVWVGVH